MALTKEYFPISTNDKWTFLMEINGNTMRIPVQVLEQEKIGEEITNPLTDMFEPARDNYKNLVLKPDGLYLCGLRLGVNGSFDILPPVKYIPLPAENNTRHDVSFKALSRIERREFDASASIIIKGPVSVETPAGTFEDCYLTIQHFMLGRINTTSRVWWAKGIGPVKGESLTEDGVLKSIKLLYAEVNHKIYGDVTQASDFEFLEAEMEFNKPHQSKPFTLREMIDLIAPLNIDMQKIEGFVLREIVARGIPQYVFKDATTNDDSAPTVEIKLFRHPADAQIYRGDRVKCSDEVVLLMEPDDHADPELDKRRSLLFRKMVALAKYNINKKSKQKPDKEEK